MGILDLLSCSEQAAGSLDAVGDVRCAVHVHARVQREKGVDRDDESRDDTYMCGHSRA